MPNRSRLRPRTVVLVLALVMAVLAVPLLSSAAKAECAAPELTVEPAATAAGQHVHISGRYFSSTCNDNGSVDVDFIDEQAEDVRLTFEQGGQSSYLVDVDAADDFTISAVALLPVEATVGAATIQASIIDEGQEDYRAVASVDIDIRAGARPTGRVQGGDRIGTAIAIAQRAYPDGAAVAYLARADVPFDALAGGSLTDGPVLLVPQCGELPGEVAAEIRRLRPGVVLSLGGDAAVCDAVLEQAGAA